jgi:toxin ParE1/3/4
MTDKLSRLTWAPRARQDLHDIYRYFARVASPDVADQLLRDIARAAERLHNRPLIGRSRDEILSGLRSVRVHPYAVFYRVVDSGVQVVRVLHERRNLPETFARETPNK